MNGALEQHWRRAEALKIADYIIGKFAMGLRWLSDSKWLLTGLQDLWDAEWASLLPVISVEELYPSNALAVPAEGEAAE